METRKSLLLEMLACQAPKKLKKLQSDLAEYDWDSDEGLVDLKREHIQSILNRYIDGMLTDSDVEEWANAFEVRGDVILGDGEREEVVFDTIYILANPVLEGALTPAVAKNLIKKLES